MPNYSPPNQAEPMPDSAVSKTVMALPHYSDHRRNHQHLPHRRHHASSTNPVVPRRFINPCPSVIALETANHPHLPDLVVGQQAKMPRTGAHRFSNFDLAIFRCFNGNGAFHPADTRVVVEFNLLSRNSPATAILPGPDTCSLTVMAITGSRYSLTRPL